MFKHSHECINSRNKYSEIEIDPSLKVSGLGVSINILKDSFPEYEFLVTKTDSEYNVECTLKNKESLKVITGTFHDDCFFNIQFNNNSELKTFILGIIKMHQNYIDNFDGCIKEPDISDEKIEEIIRIGKVSFKTIGSRVVILNKQLNVLEQLLPKMFIKESSVIYG